MKLNKIETQYTGPETIVSTELKRVFCLEMYASNDEPFQVHITKFGWPADYLEVLEVLQWENRLQHDLREHICP